MIYITWCCDVYKCYLQNHRSIKIMLKHVCMYHWLRFFFEPLFYVPTSLKKTLYMYYLVSEWMSGRYFIFQHQCFNKHITSWWVFFYVNQKLFILKYSSIQSFSLDSTKYDRVKNGILPNWWEKINKTSNDRIET